METVNKNAPVESIPNRESDSAEGKSSWYPVAELIERGTKLAPVAVIIAFLIHAWIVYRTYTELGSESLITQFSFTDILGGWAILSLISAFSISYIIIAALGNLVSNRFATHSLSKRPSELLVRASIFSCIMVIVRFPESNSMGFPIVLFIISILIALILSIFQNEAASFYVALASISLILQVVFIDANFRYDKISSLEDLVTIETSNNTYRGSLVVSPSSYVGLNVQGDSSVILISKSDILSIR